MKYLIVICLFTLAVVFYSCDEDCFKYKDIEGCPPANTFPDSSTIRSSIIGQWEWMGRGGLYSKEEFIGSDHDVIIIFTESNEYSEMEDGSLIAEGTWEIVRGYGTTWLLDFNSSIKYLRDGVWFCDDYVFFEASEIADTGYNIFRKKD